MVEVFSQLPQVGRTYYFQESIMVKASEKQVSLERKKVIDIIKNNPYGNRKEIINRARLLEKAGYNQLKKLEKEGVVKGPMWVLCRSKLPEEERKGVGIVADVKVTLADASLKEERNLVQQLRNRYSCIENIVSETGEGHLVIRIGCDTLPEFRSFIYELARRQGIGGTRTEVILSEY